MAAFFSKIVTFVAVVAAAAILAATANPPTPPPTIRTCCCCCCCCCGGTLESLETDDDDNGDDAKNTDGVAVVLIPGTNADDECILHADDAGTTRKEAISAGRKTRRSKTRCSSSRNGYHPLVVVVDLLVVLIGRTTTIRFAFILLFSCYSSSC